MQIGKDEKKVREKIRLRLYMLSNGKENNGQWAGEKDKTRGRQIRLFWSLSCVWSKVTNSTVQVSLLVSELHGSHFLAQRSRRVSSKHTCAHGHDGLNMRWGLTHCSCIFILRQEKTIAALTNKKLILSQ